jgi:hypothetical protein
MKSIAVALAVLVAAASARADEGMWIYNNFPKEKVKQKYGFEPSDRWLEEARLSSVRLAGGCSGSFVSPNGLVMTNHHCAHSCIEQLSTAKKDFVKAGFFAPEQKDEVKCPEIELNQLQKITDVTERLAAATKGLQGKEFNDAQRTEMSKIEKECSNGDESLRCDVVTLYHGGRYDLYQYKRFQDVRLVFAPEFAIAFFGGDPDNFEFPRYDLDVSFLRAYENGKPAKTDHHFKWSAHGAKESELTFVSGHPGGTDRDLTVDELEYQRNVALPDRLLFLAEYRGALTQFTKSSPEHYRVGEAELFGIENSFKAMKGRAAALLDPKMMPEKVAKEKALRAAVAADPEKQAKYGKAWDEIAGALKHAKDIRKEYGFLEGGAAVRSRLFGYARQLVRYAEESQKPNGERLREYRESALPTVKQYMFSEAPIYTDLELFRVTYTLTKLREDLGADHPVVKTILGKKSPEQLAAELVKGTRMGDRELRKKLFEGGKAALAEVANDPMIKLAVLIDPASRKLRKQYEEQIESVHKKNSELVAKARFDVEGTGNYPDATFTLRLSYGAVRGYEQDGKHVEPITTMGGAFDRATGQEPFKLPETWMKAQGKLRASSPMNFCTDNDIIGGNSGSPMFNKDLEIVGLIFDGNIQSLGGDFFFDDATNRAVGVHSDALVEALEKIYDAQRVVKELRGSSGAPSGMK